MERHKQTTTYLWLVKYFNKEPIKLLHSFSIEILEKNEEMIRNK